MFRVAGRMAILSKAYSQQNLLTHAGFVMRVGIRFKHPTTVSQPERGMSSPEADEVGFLEVQVDALDV